MFRSYYTSAIFLIALMGWASLGLTLTKLSPFLSGFLALGFFYASLLVALTGTFAILNYYFRLTVRKEDEPSRILNISLRQGFLLALMIDVGLFFQRLRVLTWWDALLLIAVVILLEFYFASRD